MKNNKIFEVADFQFLCFYNEHVKVPTLLKIGQGHQIQEKGLS